MVEPEILQQERRALLAKGLHIDVLGLVLVFVGFGALQILLDRYEMDDGFSSSFISTLGVISGSAWQRLILWELLHPQPVVNVRLLGYRSFGICCGLMFLVGFLLISTTQLLPQLAQSLLGYDATTSGMTLGVGGIATLFLMPVAGIVTGRLIQPKWLVLMAMRGHRLVDAFGASSLDLNIGFWSISSTRDLAGGVAAVPVHPDQRRVLCRLAADAHQRGVRPDQPDAQPGRQRRRVLRHHHAGRADAVPSCAAGGTHHRVQRLDWPTPLAPVDAMVQAQASIMSYLDIFWLLGLLALLVAPAVLLLPRVSKGAAMAH